MIGVFDDRKLSVRDVSVGVGVVAELDAAEWTDCWRSFSGAEVGGRGAY